VQLQQFLRFAGIGTIGFLVDTGILYAVISAGSGAFAGRVVSFLCAVAATWQLNRHFTFPGSKNTNVLQEGATYLSAMLLGGITNFAVYSIVLQVMGVTAWSPFVGVAIGSVAGLMVNFFTAKHWVFAQPQTSYVFPFRLTSREWVWLSVLSLQGIFWLGALHDIDLPGLYMDAVNPDYLAARTLHPEIRNPVNAMPTAWIPLLGNLYHGVQNYYVSLPVLGLLGFNITAIRIAQAIFGAGIVVMVFIVTERTSQSRRIAWLTAALVATEIAFLASFRTQFYIVMSGMFWLLLAIYFGLATQDGLSRPRRVFFSGLFFGLAVYSYFVFLFFIPVWLFFIIKNTRQWRTLALWIAGFVVGMLPYVLGYISLVVALGGVTPFIEWMKNSLHGLAPLSSNLGMTDSVLNSLRNASYAIQNIGNALMIFGDASGLASAEFKVWLFGFAFLLVAAQQIFVSTKRSVLPENQPSPNVILRPGQIVWLPLCFIVVSFPLGSRLWIHHFSILVPLLYVIFTESVCYLLGRRKLLLGGLLLAGMVVANCYQQLPFFSRLEQTGGNGKFSDAINRMAGDALASPAGSVYFFPDWGFFMPFSLLTGNSIYYELETTLNKISAHVHSGHAVHILFWNAGDEEKYRNLLKAAGVKDIALRRYQQRNQGTAFFELQGKPQSLENSED
jgi:putative flippase GtrA/4-amino-4-deoxy-L-arabinose transferase-like glycosyltransferase